MLTLEIPYNADESVCYVDGMAGGRQAFKSRIEAIAFIVQFAKNCNEYLPKSQDIEVRIQDADGTWRSFDAGVKSID